MQLELSLALSGATRWLKLAGILLRLGFRYDVAAGELRRVGGIRCRLQRVFSLPPHGELWREVWIQLLVRPINPTLCLEAGAQWSHQFLVGQVLLPARKHERKLPPQRQRQLARESRGQADVHSAAAGKAGVADHSRDPPSGDDAQDLDGPLRICIKDRGPRRAAALPQCEVWRL